MSSKDIWGVLGFSVLGFGDGNLGVRIGRLDHFGVKGLWYTSWILRICFNVQFNGLALQMPCALKFVPAPRRTETQ